ncbi:MAG: sigma-70 family RNA polymerase sigma factor [Lachnospiraceae bacterium]|nr:sigma-70 family RNA polymerase sigma factor [Ruminococcus sp.]MCM1274391.1 sigma-70 family RNA polymerase sigma factor [Lachnospiraceae bacterium]
MTRDEFIAANLPLVHSLANRFRGRGIDYEELFSAGSVGLVKAYDNFDESRGLRFSTYAVPVILGEIRRLFRDGGAIKMSRSLKELALKAAKARDELSKSGSEPTVSEIAEYLGVSPEAAAEAIAAGLPPVSLTSAEDGVEYDLPAESGESALIDRLALRQCIAKLPESDRNLIILRYFREKTQAQTAAILGLTQVQVSRRERKILEELRALMI